MIAKAGFPLGVLLSAVCACAAWAQDSSMQFSGPGQPSGPSASAPVTPPMTVTTDPTAGVSGDGGSTGSAGGSSGSAAPPGAAMQSPGRFMGYINYERPDCCGPVGRDGPIQYELYSRTGPDIPVGGGFLAGQLNTGWMYEGGGRSLFFNSTRDDAWVIDMNFVYQYNHSSTNEDFLLLGNSVHVSSLQRDYWGLGGGREYYFWKPSDACGTKWRFGWEAGARWGSARLDLNMAGIGGTLERVSDSIGNAYASLHTDFEWQCCDCATLMFGFRAEWDYTWQDIIPYRSDIMDVNLMVEGGIRF